MPPRPPLPQGPADLTASWLTAALAFENAALAAQVESLTLGPLDAGQSFTGGQILGCRVRYRAGSGPAAMVVKLCPADLPRRAAFAPLNAAEAAFYATAPADLPVPRCFYADADVASGTSVLLLEDLTAMRPVSVAEGCSLPDARAVMQALAAVHARHWGKAGPVPAPDFRHAIGLAAALPTYASTRAELLPDVTLPPGFLALTDAWVQDTGPLLAQMTCGPVTTLHRDCHVGNLLFDAISGQARLLDWQFSGIGRAGLDAGYFLISSLDTDLRRAHQAELLTLYHRTLCGLGVQGYAMADLWADFRLSGVLKYWVSVVATVMGDNSGPAKRAYRRADLTRLIAFCADDPDNR